jgi:hypothetical protein
MVFFQAASFGGTNIDPTAWEDKKCAGESRFPAQVIIVSIIFSCQNGVTILLKHLICLFISGIYYYVFDRSKLLQGKFVSHWKRTPSGQFFTTMMALNSASS